MGQYDVLEVLAKARLGGDGWMSVSAIADVLVSCSKPAQNTSRMVKRLLAYGFVEMRFRTLREREIRIKEIHIPGYLRASSGITLVVPHRDNNAYGGAGREVSAAESGRF